MVMGNLQVAGTTTLQGATVLTGAVQVGGEALLGGATTITQSPWPQTNRQKQTSQPVVSPPPPFP